ncbi:MAG TPA: class I SAM-dependent methyltransferase [Fimbriimonas sp.]|nr:class I SAM-dependent methyltransferase [Fimbriimonas sp.]
MSEPDYLARTKEAWGKMSVDFFEPGRRSWESSDITWGMWNVPEAEVNALGDLEQFKGKKCLEIGCGTAYISAWLARLGALPTGIDPTPEQLANARLFQQEFGLEFPLIEGYGESLPFEDGSFDFAVSEYGAAIWADPYAWIPEAARVLKPGGRLVFLRNATLAVLCSPEKGPATPTLLRDQFGLNRVEWSKDEPEEFHLPPGPLIRLMRSCGFEIENLIELQAPAGMEVRYEFITSEWAHRWPSEEIWCVRKRS